MKNVYLLIFILSIVLSYGQKPFTLSGPNITFEPNVNHKARSLKQGLNKNGDSLKFLSTKKPIRQIDIFNEDYLESFPIDSNKAAISLDTLPAGEFIVQARVGRKRIIMHLQKKEGVDLVSVRKKEQSDNQDIEDVTITSTIEKKKKKKKKKKVIYYWVVYKSNSNVGSRKSMKLLYKDEVVELIKKNKYELESGVASNNTLVVYAIYNKNKFMNKQVRNPKFYKSAKKSRVFNVVPFYNSSEAVVNESRS